MDFAYFIKLMLSTNPNTMIKKRLRVFETIVIEENENRGNPGFTRNMKKLFKCEIPHDFQKKEDEIFSYMNLDFNSDSEKSLADLDKDIWKTLIEVNDNKVDFLSEFSKESNSLLISIPSKAISEQDICSILTFYGEIEFFKVSKEENHNLVLVKFYDLRSSKRAFNEISYNFDKLLNIFEKEKFSVLFENSKSEIFENYFLVIKLSENVKNFFPLLQFIELVAELEKILVIDANGEFSIKKGHKESLFFPKTLIFKFFNSKEKHIVNFLLSKITQSGKKEKIIECHLKNLKIFLEKNEKSDEIQDSFMPIANHSEYIQPLKESDFNLNKIKLSLSSIFSKKINVPVSSVTAFGMVSLSENKQKITSKSTVNFQNKENKNVLPSPNIEYELKRTNKDKKNNYKIVYDQNYSGIKKRNTPDEERKKYVITIQNIINGKDVRTTVMIKNIPTFVNQVDLLKTINKNYSTAYNFFYLPIDFNKKLNAGYAFINFKSSKLIINFFLELENQPWEFPNNGKKVCYLSYARIQGFRSICEHFDRSSIMKQTDEKVKPIIILD